ncbi:MAG: hypothetical protein WCT48_03235 [Candidatus Paceibacterota bacterium]
MSQENKMGRGQGNELLNKLEDAGLSGFLAQYVIESKDNRLAEKIVEFVEEYGRAVHEEIWNCGGEGCSGGFGFYGEPDTNQPLCFRDSALTEFYNREKPRRGGITLKI